MTGRRRGASAGGEGAMAGMALHASHLPATLGFGALTFAGADGAARGGRVEKRGGGGGDGVDGGVEGGEVGLGGLGEAAHFANVLEGGGADLVGGGGRLEVVEDADVTAHGDIVALGAGSGSGSGSGRSGTG